MSLVILIVDKYAKRRFDITGFKLFKTSMDYNLAVKNN